MRKEQKEQVEGFAELLIEAHEEILNCIMKNDGDTTLDILEQCYQGAVKTGKLIEETEGEDFATVHILEEYCELVYNLHSQICKGEEINCSGVQKVLRKQQIKLENSIQNDIKIRKEVVFLPYKVAMWDSLESVWRAAKDDPDYDVYVIPIPYYDKNPDNTLGELHYEGDKYPKEVPITDYRKYNLEERKPDIIFIHNPYDEFNSVTSVHPDYYSCRICTFTKMLVYIPYFVAELGVPKELLLLPGTMYANKVIVNSEKERQDYIEKFEEWLKEKGDTNGYEEFMPNWREKFLVLGSPKYDKAIATKREISNLPIEWKNKIYNEDGTRKKVLFYNTSITAALASDNAIKKIESTINIIRNRDDVVMWWRPHPLYESTLRNTRPYMLRDYKRVVEDYVKNNIGIFDDTVDLDRAIAESDMYYGDASSVMYLFQKVNKPVMMQNMELV